MGNVVSLEYIYIYLCPILFFLIERCFIEKRKILYRKNKEKNGEIWTRIFLFFNLSDYYLSSFEKKLTHSRVKFSLNEYRIIRGCISR